MGRVKPILVERAEFLERKYSSLITPYLSPGVNDSLSWEGNPYTKGVLDIKARILERDRILDDL